MSQCKVIAIANQKDGVGKTTTAFNLGVALAKEVLEDGKDRVKNATTKIRFYTLHFNLTFCI